MSGQISPRHGTKTYTYVYNGSQLTYMTVDGHTLWFSYDAHGPMYVKYDSSTYQYITNLQGDIIAIVNSSGTVVVEYTYDAWGNILSTSGSMASTLGAYNPLRYRSYVYDTESRLYYLQSRYYDPKIGRFINADDVDYLGADGNLTSYNLFAYCGNNPVMGYDPTGYWDWGGFLIGLAIVVTAGASIAYGAGTSPDTLLISGAAATTGATMMYAAATDSTMAVDVSVSKQALSDHYVKGGGSLVIDFSNDNVNYYTHVGFGKGYSSGISYSVGIVNNYDSPDDYSRHFVDVNVGCYIGIDHCWDPLTYHDDATQAWSISFSKGISYGVGYDYYFSPKEVLSW